MPMPEKTKNKNWLNERLERMRNKWQEEVANATWIKVEDDYKNFQME